jgi:hypothetical protein
VLCVHTQARDRKNKQKMINFKLKRTEPATLPGPCCRLGPSFALCLQKCGAPTL